jgi:hypothetical protein
MTGPTKKYIIKRKKVAYNNFKIITMENEKYSHEEGGMCEGGSCERCSDEECCGGHGMGYGGHGMGCQQMYGMHCGGRYHILRWVLGIAILAIVFGAGIKLGEFKERMPGIYGNGGYNTGYNMMQRGYGNTPDAYYYRGGMMQGLQGGINVQQVPTR